ncbi:MAG: rRNA maturation RNase YbeY [Candidatus Staskawiczbacteria bacterium RIFCSPLOWO2_12_FULL_37_15]|uniref:Endoribonuclease YbeY n=1 Tax=Candidatus Staskawiczbacteria bacterium RIFCSPLOWO2_12_FULL_37_15 TaxID=1802218 RepID=A0A1G2IKW1_9BACT|nr:MAG: rRNA maturation RNase YbeY [Candidatus Staskawiczbacteria bacterium RIFCSPLOWO2_12_FULL_37_15]
MIEINNLSSFPVDKKLFTGIAKKVLKGENRNREKVSLAFVGKKEMQKLNKKFRGKNKPTDVLAFGENSKFQIPNSKLNYLGEIVICPEVVKENGKKFGADSKKEIIKVFVHGILHLLGYDHEKSLCRSQTGEAEKEAKKMEVKEQQFLSKIKI